MRALGILILTAALAILTACAGDPPPPPSITIHGTITVRGDYPNRWYGKVGEACETSGGYTDIKPGAQVVITDASATTLALGILRPGAQTERHGCSFAFTVRDIPAGHPFYGIEVTHRGRLQYTEAQLATPLDLTLGD